MSRTDPIRVLILEDNVFDAELMVRELRRSGLEIQADRVYSEQTFAAKLALRPHIVLSDNAVPLFGSREALQHVRAHGLDIPFIVVSGSLREDALAEAMRDGADDYVSKDELSGLGAAVARALDKRSHGA